MCSQWLPQRALDWPYSLMGHVDSVARQHHSWSQPIRSPFPPASLLWTSQLAVIFCFQAQSRPQIFPETTFDISPACPVHQYSPSVRCPLWTTGILFPVHFHFICIFLRLLICPSQRPVCGVLNASAQKHVRIHRVSLVPGQIRPSKIDKQLTPAPLDHVYPSSRRATSGLFNLSDAIPRVRQN